MKTKEDVRAEIKRILRENKGEELSAILEKAKQTVVVKK